MTCQLSEIAFALNSRTVRKRKTFLNCSAPRQLMAIIMNVLMQRLKVTISNAQMCTFSRLRRNLT